MDIQTAEKFLVEILGIPNWQETFQNDKYQCLSLIMTRFLERIFFQNISLAAQTQEIRKVPNIKEIIELGFSGKGGICMEQNYFFKLLLSAIGFDAILTSGSWSGSIWLRTHCVIIVRLAPPAVYFIDVSSANNPVQEPVPLHNLPYSGMAGGYRYEYRHLAGTNEFGRFQIGGHFYSGDFKNGKKKDLKLAFNLNPIGYDEIKNDFQDIYTNVEKSHMLRSLMLFRYLRLPGDGSDLEFIMIYGKRMIQCRKMSRIITEFDTYEEIRPVIRKYWPEIPPDDIEVAFGKFETFYKK